jgi:hypothetical protein
VKPGGNVAWLSAAAAAIHLGYVFERDVVKNGVVEHKAGDPNLNAFYVWKHRAQPKTHWLRGRMRFRVVDLDACVEAEPAPAARPKLAVAS